MISAEVASECKNIRYQIDPKNILSPGVLLDLGRQDQVIKLISPSISI